MKRIETLTPAMERECIAARDEWLRWGLCTDPADRGRAEDGIAAMYALDKRERPEFVWVASPAGAGLLRAELDDPSVLDSVWDSVRASVLDSVLDSVGDSVRDSVWDSVWDSVLDSVWDSVRASVLDSVGDSVRDSVWDSVRDSVWDSVWDSVRDSVLDSVGDSATSGALWGAHDAGWCGWADAMRRIGVRYDCEDALDAYLDIARSATWWYPHERLCVVVDRPERVSVEPDPRGGGRVRIHDESDAAIRYRDGWSVYAIHGVVVPERVVTEPESLSIEELRAIENVEARRIAVERFGVARYLRETAAKTIDMDTFGGTPRALVRDGDGEQWLIGTDGSTERVYHMAAPREAATCREAHVALCGFDESRIAVES